MRIVSISDTHNLEANITVPDGDILIHAGDLTMDGTPSAFSSVFTWLSEMPHKRVLAIPGNHDLALQSDPHTRLRLRDRFPRVELLIDSSTTIGNGIKVWGSPWQPWFYDWAFNFALGTLGAEQARRKWAEIPEDTAVLITHGPLHGVLDTAADGTHVGCAELRARLDDLPCLRLHVFGHIHESYGALIRRGALHLNAAVCDSHYLPSHRPIVVDWSGAPDDVPVLLDL